MKKITITRIIIFALIFSMKSQCGCCKNTSFDILKMNLNMLFTDNYYSDFINSCSKAENVLSSDIRNEGKGQIDKTTTTIYFDLAAGNVEIDNNTYIGARYVANDNGGFDIETIKGNHDVDNVYYVYQTTETFNRDGYSIIDNRGSAGFISGTFIRPSYAGVKGPNGEPWADYITNNKSVEDVIEMWDDGVYVKGSAAENENYIGIAQVRDAGRTHTPYHIKITGSGTQYKLSVDNIYSISQQNSLSRTMGGITYMPNGNTQLTVNILGDCRVGYIHIDNTKTDKIIFDGSGSMTVADVDFLTKKAASEESTYGSLEGGYGSNYWNSAIGNNDTGNGDVYGLTINGGVIFAGTTKAENCTAIGGGGNGYGEIIINGGVVTAVATTTGTAIGGGIGFRSNGGKGNVNISGGKIYAYNFANRWSIPSSAIGGAGAKESTGNVGIVKISDGNVYAESTLGTAIGGGSSFTLQGGDAEITITGGSIIAKSNAGAGIGGGSACTGGGEGEIHGGTATIDISGNPIIRTGSIGGGITNATNGKIGSANINISGGDIQAQFILAAGAKSIPTFTMSDGTIRNSYVYDKEYLHIKKQGGAVYLEDGTFEMSGGYIENCSAEHGGAIYINSLSSTSTFSMNGGEIRSCFATGVYDENNNLVEKGHGGAVYMEEGEFTISNTAIMRNNSAVSGGAVYLAGTGVFNVSGGTLQKNEVSENGGAIYLNKGTFTMKAGNVINNQSKKGHGGAVYIASGIVKISGGEVSGNNAIEGRGGGFYVSDGSITLSNGIIASNKAKIAGGGICMENGSVNIDEGFIMSNSTEGLGGGLYVHNNAEVSIDFSGGFIKENTAANGGGICVDGPINLLVTNVEVAENTAFNGGGVCLLNGSQMYFGAGRIISNKAIKKDNTSIITAYQKSVEEVHGIGGGVFLSSGSEERPTKLEFTELEELGLYGNLADNGAADIFANGKHTSVLLPPDEYMIITNFSAAGQFCWVEDYITNDPNYGYGTMSNSEWDAENPVNLRYTDSLNDSESKRYSVKPDESGTPFTCYISLTLGYEIIYVTIRKKGLQKGESAIFYLSQTGKENTMTIVLTGDGKEWVEKKVALVSDTWNVTEKMNWSWTYKNQTASLTKNLEESKVFEFENTQIEDSTLPRYNEVIKVNVMGENK